TTRGKRPRSSPSARSLPLTRHPLGAGVRICLPKSHGMSFNGELSMTRTLMIAVLVLAAASTTLGQAQSATREQGGNTEQTIRQLDHERIKAQISADAVALDRLYATDFLGVGP